MSFTCLDVAKSAGLVPGKPSGQESIFLCPNHDDHHPSLSINPTKDVFLCGPCKTEGTPWQLAAFLGRVDPSDKGAVKGWLVDHGLASVGNQGSRITTTYSYVDEADNPLFEVVRYEPKGFKQRRPDGNGSYIWNLDGVRRVLYRLPEIAKGECIFIVEGEKDVEALRAIGFAATCNPGGAGKWLPEYAELFKQHQSVTIISDNDKPGQAHSQAVAASLTGKVASVKVLELPVAPKGDVSDWLAGRDRDAAAEELSRLADGASEWKPATAETGYIEFAPAFLDVEDPPMRYLIGELLPEQVIALTHGEPRTRKSWAALEIAVSLTSGKAAFGLQRLSVPEIVPVLYLSQEDGARPVRARMKRLLKGYNLPIPKQLAFAVHKGIDLENPDWQAKLIRDVKQHGFKVVIFDPIRRFAESVDKGPAEVRKVTGFLRSLVVETGATVVINHHDVKPGEKVDTRRRSQKASGGDWFAASECPIAFESAGEGRTFVVPEDYKFGVDPAPFTFRIEEDEARTWVRLVGENASVEQTTELATQEKVVSYLAEHKAASGNAIATGCRIRRDDVKTALDNLSKSGRVDCVRKGPKTSWFLKSS